MNLSDLFPEINLLSLANYVDQWVEQYDYIESIILYQAPDSSPHGKKYALVFEPLKKESIDKFPEVDENFFKDVCKSETKENYRNEWLFLTKTPTDATKGNALILYEKKDEKVSQRAFDIASEIDEWKELSIHTPTDKEILDKNIKKLEKEYLSLEESPPKNKSKLRPVQKHKIACQRVANKLWGKDPTITIADMVMLNEITAACDDKVYNEKTIRNWIKNLCPNRDPGRRPSKK